MLLDDRDDSTTAQEGVYGISVVHQRIVRGRERFSLLKARCDRTQCMCSKKCYCLRRGVWLRAGVPVGRELLKEYSGAGRASSGLRQGREGRE